MQKLRLTRETEDAEHRRESFKKIFDQNIWSKENPSGGGSTLAGKVSFHLSQIPFLGTKCCLSKARE